MAKSKLPVDPLSLVVGVALGAGVYLAVVYGWPLLEPYIPIAPLSVQGVEGPAIKNW